MSDMTNKKLHKELTRNKSEEIYLKAFDSIRNVRPEYTFLDSILKITHTHSHAWGERIYGNMGKELWANRNWGSTEYFPWISKYEESMQVNLQNTLGLHHGSNSRVCAAATEETEL